MKNIGKMFQQEAKKLQEELTDEEKLWMPDLVPEDLEAEDKINQQV